MPATATRAKRDRAKRGSQPPRVEFYPGHEPGGAVEVFNRKVEHLLRTQQKTNLDLAYVLGRNPSRVTKWLSGTGNPHVGDLVKMAKFFAVSLNYLCDPKIPVRASATMTDDTSYDAETSEVFSMVLAMGADEARRRLLMLPPGGSVKDLGYADLSGRAKKK